MAKYRLAKVYEDLGRKDEALELINECESIYPKGWCRLTPSHPR